MCYRSPNSTHEINQSVIHTIAETVQKKFSHTLIMGNFNFPRIDWDLLTTNGGLHEQDFIENFNEWYIGTTGSTPSGLLDTGHSKQQTS